MDDITYLRLAETTDGIHFKDDGALQGLNDPTGVTVDVTRWLATAGAILKLDGNRYGLLFSGGGCIDGDSDAFHYIGYAESTDLAPLDGRQRHQQSPCLNTALHHHCRCAQPRGTMGWYQGRAYAPSATLDGHHDLTVVFAGYHTAKPKNGLGDYRTIGRVSLHSNKVIQDASTNTGDDTEE